MISFHRKCGIDYFQVLRNIFCCWMVIFFVDVPEMVHFPCLKILQLGMGVQYANVDSPRSFFSGCPLLEDLTVDS